LDFSGDRDICKNHDRQCCEPAGHLKEEEEEKEMPNVSII